MSILNNGVTLQNGKYTIVKMLGQGGFGITYLAVTHMSLNGQLGNMDVDVYVTIKEFFISTMNTRSLDGKSIDQTDSTLVKDYKRKFIREAMSLSHLHHDNIVKVLEVFEENNTAYYVMEYIDGGTVDELIRKNGKLAPSQAVDITHQVCNALRYMHGNRMLHLDLKPKNIMLTQSGIVKLIDFGLAKQYNTNGEPEESTSLGLGTPGYAPIEQATYRQDGSLPVTLDIYALGATMYKMLTGVVPPESSVVINEGLPMQPLRNVSVPSQLIAIVSKAMAPLKRNRIQSVQELDTLLWNFQPNLAGNGGNQQPGPIHYTPQQTGGFTPKGNGGYTPTPPPIGNGGFAFTGNGGYTPTPTGKGGFTPTGSNINNDEEKKAKKRKIIIWSSVGGVLLLAVILGAFLLGNGKSNRISDNDEDEDDTEWVDRNQYTCVESPEYSEELLKYAKDGIADAQYDLGVCYENGFGIEADEEEAAYWYKKAANQDQANAQNAIGRFYYYGTVVEEDEEEAVKWFRKAANQGDAIAQGNLGYCYENGTGVETNTEEAARWYRKAADQGNAYGQAHLGSCYLYGTGVEEDNDEAVRWIRKAVNQDYAEAQTLLGYCYEYGWGVEEDFAQAKEWFQKAADQGDLEAQDELEKLNE